MGSMRLMRPMGLMGLIGLMGLVGLVSCSEDSETERHYVTIEAQSCSTPFVEQGEGSESRALTTVTRSWTPPDGYYDYTAISNMFASQKSLMNKSIDVFFTRDGKDNQRGTLFYNEAGSEPHWRLSNMEIESGAYQVYGYIPKEDADNASITSLEGSYSTGAVLTVTGLSTVTPSDVSVIIGAKDGRGTEDDTGETVTQGESDGIRVSAGKFDVNFKGGENVHNYIFLLFEHIYSSLRFRFTIDATYNTLRTIKLKKLELIPCVDKNGNVVDESGNMVYAKYNATITLRKRNNNDDPNNFSPIKGDIQFVVDPTSTSVAYKSIFEGETTLSSSVPEQFMGSFVPGVTTFFKLRSTYDVYDKNVTTEHPEGNLIRKNCQAENLIDLREHFSINGTEYGECFSYTIKVQPTYLYVLSEPDLDNPTLKIK
jgi:hypothetical protein